MRPDRPDSVIESPSVSAGEPYTLSATVRNRGGGIIIGNTTVNGVTYTIHNSKWQRRTNASSGWVDIPGTERTGQVCSYSPTEPGQYRGVAELSIGGTRNKYSSKNTLTVAPWLESQPRSARPPYETAPSGNYRSSNRLRCSPAGPAGVGACRRKIKRTCRVVQELILQEYHRGRRGACWPPRWLRGPLGCVFGRQRKGGRTDPEFTDFAPRDIPG